MELNEQEKEHNIHEFFKKLLFERDERIRALEAKVSTENGTDTDWQERYNTLQRELAAKHVQTTEKIEALEAALQTEKSKNKQAKLQPESSNKAGSLLWTLAFLGLGLFVGFFLHKWFFTPKDSNAVAFEKMKADHQFNFEFELSKGRFEKVESSLKTLKETEYPQLSTEIDFMLKLLAAAERKFKEAGLQPDESGISLPAPSDEPVIVEQKNRKTLTVTEDKLSVRQEASNRTKRLARLRKGEQVYIIDRTTKRDKIAFTVDDRRSTIRDYWYKIEMEDGIEGWVFGYFTTRSINSVQYDEPPKTPEPTPEAMQASIKDTTKNTAN